MRRRVCEREAVEHLRAIPAGTDAEEAHKEAEAVLLALAGPVVGEAYWELVARCNWWRQSSPPEQPIMSDEEALARSKALLDRMTREADETVVTCVLGCGCVKRSDGTWDDTGCVRGPADA